MRTFVDEGLAAGRDWKMIAVALNETGRRSPRGTAFTPVAATEPSVSV